MQNLNEIVSFVKVVRSYSNCDRICLTIKGKEGPYKGFKNDLELEFRCADGDAERYLKDNLGLTVDELDIRK